MSARAALEIGRFGWDAAALVGGIRAWSESYPVESHVSAELEPVSPRFIEPGSRLS